MKSKTRETPKPTVNRQTSSPISEPLRHNHSERPEGNTRNGSNARPQRQLPSWPPMFLEPTPEPHEPHHTRTTNISVDSAVPQ